MFRGRFKLDTFEGARCELALQVLGSGGSVVVGDHISLTCEDGTLKVEVASAWGSVNAVTQSIADAELKSAHETLVALLTDPALAAVVGNREHAYELVVDYDMSTVLVATLRDGETRMEVGGG